MEKRADTADISVLFFLSGTSPQMGETNFLLGPISKILIFVL